LSILTAPRFEVPDGYFLVRLTTNLVSVMAAVKLFWSVTVYDSDARSVVQTDTNIAARSSYDKLKANEEGIEDRVGFCPD
jgi:hypothetical protein